MQTQELLPRPGAARGPIFDVHHIYFSAGINPEPLKQDPNAGRKRGPLQADDAGNRCGYLAAIEFGWPSAPTKTTRFFSGTVPGLNSWLRVSIGSIQVSPAL